MGHSARSAYRYPGFFFATRDWRKYVIFARLFIGFGIMNSFISHSHKEYYRNAILMHIFSAWATQNNRTETCENIFRSSRSGFPRIINFLVVVDFSARLHLSTFHSERAERITEMRRRRVQRMFDDICRSSFDITQHTTSPEAKHKTMQKGTKYRRLISD